MNVALVAEKYPPDAGGLAVSAARLAGGLMAAGVAVQVFCLDTRLEPGRTLTVEPLQPDEPLVHRLGAYARTDDTLAAWFDQVAAQHARSRFDLLHGYFITRAGFVAAYAGRFLGIPSVVSARGNDLDRALFDPGKAAHIFYALQHATAVTTNARDLQRKAQALAPGREVTLIPNGVDARSFHPLPRDARLAAELGLGDRPVVGFVGEARAKKGLATLLLAFRELAARRDADLLLAGGVRKGEDRDLFNVFCKQNPGLRIHSLPDAPLAQMPAVYSLIDVLALPSTHDGLPNALLEGMACGRAIAATPAGGIPDALVDGQNGLLVPVGNPETLAAALEKLLADGELRTRLGAAARATVAERFTLGKEVIGNLDIYRELVLTQANSPL